MNKFVKIPANKNSLANRKPVRGIGINDSDYRVTTVVNGKRSHCPIHQKWISMFTRCYSKEFHRRQPTYIGCTVCKEWLTFSNFAKWFELNNVDGYELDKDIKLKGNKVYGPDACLFVPSCVNSILSDSGATRGDWLIGVTFDKKRNKFASKITINNKTKNIGRFNTNEEAHSAYVKAKNTEIMRKCTQYPEFSQYLINHLIIDECKS